MEMETEAAIGKAVNLLKEAATTGGIPVAAVCQALVQLEKEKLAVSFSFTPFLQLGANSLH